MANLQGTTIAQGQTLVFERPTNAQSGNYTMALSDRGKVVEFSNSAAATVTIPPDSSVAWPTGTVLYICSVGTGILTLAAGAGVTLSRSGGFGQYEEIYLRKRAADNWIVVDSPKNLTGTGSVPSTTGGGFVTFVYTTAGNSNSFTVN